METKENQIMNYLMVNIFNPVLNSTKASIKLKRGIRWTILNLEKRDANGMVRYFWSAIIGTENSIGFSRRMRNEGFDRFEEILEDFRVIFNDRWLRH